MSAELINLLIVAITAIYVITVFVWGNIAVNYGIDNNNSTAIKLGFFKLGCGFCALMLVLIFIVPVAP